MRRLVTLALSAATFIAIAGASARAGERRPVPALALADLTGAPLEGSGLPDTGTWLLVFVRPACPGCETMLEQMNSDERPEPRRIAVIVSGAAEDASAIKAKYANLGNARWLLDADGSAARALHPPTAPAVWGVRNQTIEWDLAGPLRGGAELESILFSWLRRE